MISVNGAGETVALWQIMSRSSVGTLANALWHCYLRDVVRSSIGLVAAELFTDIDDGAGVSLQRQAYYIDPSFEPMDLAGVALKPDPGLSAPGVGLAGVLWGSAARGGESAAWSLLSTIAANDELPDDPRAIAAARAFGLVASVYLEARHAFDPALKEWDNGGLLIVYARLSAAQVVLHPDNVTYLRTVAQLGGSLVATAAARDQLGQAKRNRSEAWRKLRLLVRSGSFAADVGQLSEKLQSGEAVLEPLASARLPKQVRVCISWVAGYAAKFRGVRGAKAPPVKGVRVAAAWVTCAWTWLGVALTLLGLSGLNQLTLAASDNQYMVLLGSFGALMALQFGAPNSPLAQPRNAVGGCLLSASISILFFYVSGPAFLALLPKWAAAALAPATAIAVCQRVNLLHPPAGAAAFIFVTAGPKITDLGWMYLLLPLTVGNIFCCLAAMVINNAVRDRQYPVFW